MPRKKKSKYTFGPLPCYTFMGFSSDSYGNELAPPREGEIRASNMLTKLYISGEWRDCTSEYDAWRGASQRCENPKNKAWLDYGGRGILFRFASFHSFIEHLGLKPSPDLSLDRINNDGHYERGNVRWTTKDVQMGNRRGR